MGKGDIRPLHDRVEVLNPEAIESFPCTSSRIPILDDEARDQAATPVKGRKKHSQETNSPPEKPNGHNGVPSTDAKGSLDGARTGASAHAATDASVHIDPDLMLKGENGEEISDKEMLF